MAYEVTATRRRPKSFDELAGQEFVAATLKKSIESGHIAPAYLFSGPRGCGKTSAARILARSLNCEKGPTANPCGVCPSCQEINRGVSLDVIEIDGASNTSVNDVRQIREEVLFPPTQPGRRKIYIIDEVHMLSNNAFNALLKTIEEPPPYIVFIFATTELHEVPATIKSRCQQFSFRLIAIETIRDILKDTCAEMGIEAEDEALFWIAKESTGSLRDAYTLFDQVASFSGGHITTQLIREKLGLVGLDRLNALAEACAANDNAEALGLMDSILESGVAIEQFVIDLAAYYRSLLLIKSNITKESLLGYSPERFSAKALERWDLIRLEQGLSIVLDLYRNIRYSLSPRFELETAVSKLCWLDKWISPADLSQAIGELRAHIFSRNNGPGPGSAAAPLPEGEKKNELSWGQSPFSSGPAPGKDGEEGRTERPLAEAGGFPASDSIGYAAFAAKPDEADINLSKPGGLTAEFKKRMAAKANSAQAVPTASGAGTELKNGAGGPGENSPNMHNENRPNNGEAAPQEKRPAALEMVRQLFRGTIVQER